MALDFDGSNDYINNNAAIFTAGSQTISMWFRKEGGTGVRMSLIEGGHATDWTQAIELITTNKLRTWVMTVPQANVDSTTTPSLDVWYHVVSVYDATAETLEIYVNGISENVVAATGIKTVGAGLHIGTYRGADSRWFNGKIEEVTIWDRALSADDVKMLFESKRRTYSDANCLLLHHLDEQSGTIAHDYSGNEYDGTLIGFTVPGDWVEGVAFSGRAKPIQTL